MTLTPEDRLKRRLKIVSIVCIIVVAGLLIFIKLYVDERAMVQKQYRMAYSQSLQEAQEILKDYTADIFDAKGKYIRATAQLGTARTVFFLTNSVESQKTSINEIYTAFVKYPDQMTQKAQSVAGVLEQIYQGEEEEGFLELDLIISSIDRLGT